MDQQLFDLFAAQTTPLDKIPDHRLAGLHDGSERIALHRHIGQDGLFLKGEWVDELVFAILDQEWRARIRPDLS